jgi:hypothetical protein
MFTDHIKIIYIICDLCQKNRDYVSKTKNLFYFINKYNTSQASIWYLDHQFWIIISKMMSFWRSSCLRPLFWENTIKNQRVSTILPLFLIFIFLKDNAADVIPVLLAQVTFHQNTVCTQLMQEAVSYNIVGLFKPTNHWFCKVRYGMA